MPASSVESVVEVLKDFDKHVKTPTVFLSGLENAEEFMKNALRSLYSCAKDTEKNCSSVLDTLPELVTSECDTEQLWQQLDLHNKSKEKQLEKLKLSETLQNAGEVDNVDESDEEYNSDSIEEEEEESSGSDYEDGEQDVLLSGSDDSDKEAEANTGDSENDTDANGSDDSTFDDNSTHHKTPKKHKSSGHHSSEVDDEFFKLSEMEEFCLEAEKADEKGLKSGSDLVNYFEDVPLDNDAEEGKENGPMYSDFFGGNTDDQNADIAKKKRKSVRFQLPEKGGGSASDSFPSSPSSSEEDEDEKSTLLKKGKKSSFEQRQERLGEKIQQLEHEIVAEKPWQMKGEVTAKKRPQNSLLEEVLEFDLTTRPPPVITEKAVAKLEDVIVQRIKDKAWDDVERKVKPVDAPHEFKKKLVLNQEKSKLSLAQIYEQEYIKQREAKKTEGESVVCEDPQEHKELKSMLDVLFRKLDALSNYHFTPLPATPKVDIIENIPAITMEDPAPVTVADAALLAPEEVQAKQKGTLMSKEERTMSDKKRERRKKKMKQRIRKKQIEEREKKLKKLNVGMGNKYAKEKIRKDLEDLTKSNANVSKFFEHAENKKAATSSRYFFSALQEEVGLDAEAGGKRKSSSKQKISSNKKPRKK